MPRPRRLEIEEVVNLLKGSFPFSNIEESLLGLIASNSMTRSLQPFEPGEWILRQNYFMPKDVGLYVLVKGLAHVVRESSPLDVVPNKKGPRVNFRHVAFRYPRQTSGALLALSRAPAEVGLRCITGCQVLKLHLSDYQLAMRHSHVLANAMYIEWSRGFRQYAARTELDRYLSPEEAVAAFFYEAGMALSHCPNVMFLPMKREDVATFTGVKFERIRTKILPQFLELGLISARKDESKKERGKIYIPEPGRFLEYLSGCRPETPNFHEIFISMLLDRSTSSDHQKWAKIHERNSCVPQKFNLA